MTTAQLRKTIHKKVDELDGKRLKEIYELVDDHSSNGHNRTIIGKPMSLDAYKKKILRSRADYAAGRYLTQEQLEREAKTW